MQGFLFTTRIGRPPSSNKVAEYQRWPILDALDIPHWGLHAFRHSVASFIVDAGYAPEVVQKQLHHEVAAELNISPYTLETHCDHILEKLNLHDSAELVLHAVRKGIIQ